MSPEETIRECIFYYPSLFQSKADVLSHLFCTFGNGYEWIDGKLVNIYADDREDPYERAVAYLQDRSRDSSPFFAFSMKDVYIKLYLEDVMLIKATHERIDELCESMAFERYNNLSQLSRKYSYLLNWPDDITPEWKACLDEARAFFLPFYESEDATAVQKLSGLLIC